MFKKSFKKIIGILVLIIIISTAVFGSVITADAAFVECDRISGDNNNDNDYSTWGKVIKSYLVPCSDNTYMRFDVNAYQGKYYVEYYSSDFKQLSSKIIDYELPIFGGFYATANNYYVLSGQNNYYENNNVECYRLTKYDKNWNRITSVGLYDCNTYRPFAYGSARFAELGNYLIVRTCHEMYKSSDGKNHQASVTIQYNTANMTVTDSCTAVKNSKWGYVSHSFNQFIKLENNRIIAVDHGDAYPRSISLIKFTNDASDGNSIDNKSQVYDILKFPGGIGDNYTGASIGGFEISSSSYLIAFNSVAHNDTYYSNRFRHIYVAVLGKDNSYSLKHYSLPTATSSPSTPHLVKISNTEFLLLWNEGNDLKYVKLNHCGDVLTPTYTVKNTPLTDCQPIVANGKIIWYSYRYNYTYFNMIDRYDVSQFNCKEIYTGHNNYINSYPTSPTGQGTKKCTKCGEIEYFSTQTSIDIKFKKETAEYYGAYNSNTVYDVSQKIMFKDNNINNSSLIITSSDSKNTTIKEDYLSFKKEGVYTVTFTHKLNPTVKKSYKIKVYHTDSNNNASCDKCRKSISVTSNKDGLYKFANKVYHLKNRKLVRDTGVKKYNGVLYHYKNGVQSSGSLLYKYNGVWTYFKNGTINKSNTLVKHTNGKWYHVKNGKLYKDTTLFKYNGQWYHLKNGVKSNFTGLYKYKNNWYYIKNGAKCMDDTLVKHTNGKWYHVKNGKVTKNTGIVYYNNKMYYVKNGVKSNLTTLVKIYDSWVYIKNGKQSFDTTLLKYKGTWVYINNGYLDKYSDTLVKYSGKWYHVKNGKLAKDTAIVYYNGRRYYVKNGTVRFIDGIVKVNGLSYWINDGVVYTQILYR